MIITRIKKDLLTGFRRLKLEIQDNFTVSKNNNYLGDYSTNVCLISSKINNKSPKEIANKIKTFFEKNEKNKDFYEKLSVSGPGFINFTIKKSVFVQELIKMRKQGKDYGNCDFGNKEKVLIEFISANPTGPLNVVSARSAAFGDSLYRIMKKIGYKPTREFYINDAGNQVEILAESLELRYREVLGEDIGEFPLEAYHGEYLIDLAKELVEIDGTKLLHFAEKDRLNRIEDFALRKIHKMQVESLNRFDVQFDSWISEKSIRHHGILEEALSYLAEAGCTYESDEAVWFASTMFGDEKDRVLIKTDGNVTYLVPDIAYHLTKYQRGFDHIIDVLGPDHHGYVPRLLAAMEALGFKDNPIEIVYLQQVNLFNEHEKIKMSKREGKIITMDEIIKEVGLDAARFFFVDRKPSAHLNFDMKLALEKSNDNPAYYVQYAHARIVQLAQKARREHKFRLERLRQSSLENLKDVDFLLIKKAVEFQSILISASISREPHRLSNYLQEFAGIFHKYYNDETIIDMENKAVSEARLYLLLAVKEIFAEGLRLIGVSAPDKM